MPELARISVTPVKGTALHHPDRVSLGPAGIAGNRRFHLIDERGALFSGDRHGPLVQVRTSYEPDTGHLRCSFPDGTVIEGPTDATGEPVVTDFYGRPCPGTVADSSFGDAFSDHVGRPLRLVRLDREGDGSDVRPLSVVSFASVADLAERGGHAGDLDARRFRMNLELGGCLPYEEDTWDDRLVRVGDALLRFEGPVPRCVFTTLSPETGVKDFDTLKQIARYRPPIQGEDRGIPFGVYASVERAGLATVGDAVAPV